VTLANFKIAVYNGDWVYVGDESIEVSNSGPAKMSLKIRKYDDSHAEQQPDRLLSAAKIPMHEAALAIAALPAPTFLLGLRLRPYSLGHDLLLIREESNQRSDQGPRDSVHTTFDALIKAALICSQSWEEYRRMNSDPFLQFKLWLWKKRLDRMRLDPLAELKRFTEYREQGSLEFPISDILKPGQKTGRLAGAPFLLRLNQFLQIHLRKSEAEAWDYPLGLAKMRMEAFYETEGAIDIYNQQDREFDDFVAEQEALAAGEWRAQNGESNLMNPS
jgi:hypothetical protein